MEFIKNINHYYKFIRPFAFVGIFITAICSSLIAVNTLPYVSYNWLYILIGAFSCGLLASAAHTINNIYDLDVDKINKPFRALPSKEISIREVWIITSIFYSLSFLSALFIGLSFFSIILMMSIFTILYSCPPFNFKRYGVIANITIAIPRGLLVVVAGWAVIKSIGHVLPWYIGSISFMFLIGAITTKDIADIEGDRRNKCQTFPVRHGLNKTVKLITPCFIMPFLLIPLGIYLKILSIHTLPLMLLLFYGIYIIQLINKKPDKLTKIENNHISWKHTYILYMILQVGMGIAYII